MINFNNKL